MDSQDILLNISSKETFVYLKDIDSMSPKTSFYYAKDSKKDPVIILEDIGNHNLSKLSPVREKENHINDNDKKSLSMDKMKNIANNEIDENFMENFCQPDECLSEKVDDVIPTIRKEISPLTEDSCLSHPEESNEANVNLDTEYLQHNAREIEDYDVKKNIHQRRNIDSSTLKKLCLKSKATVHVVRLRQCLGPNNVCSGKSYTKKICNLDHKKFRKCIFDTVVCKSNTSKEKPLTYESNGHKFKDSYDISNEKEISDVKYTESFSDIVNDSHTVHSNSENNIKRIMPSTSTGCKDPAIDKIPTIVPKRMRLENTNCDKEESSQITDEISIIKHVAPLPVSLKDSKISPSNFGKDLISKLAHKSVSWEQPCTNKVYTNNRKRVRFDDENLNFDMNYDLKISNRIKPFSIELKRLKINKIKDKKILKTNGHQFKDADAISDDIKSYSAIDNEFDSVQSNLQIDKKDQISHFPVGYKDPNNDLKRLRINFDITNFDDEISIIKHVRPINKPCKLDNTEEISIIKHITPLTGTSKLYSDLKNRLTQRSVPLKQPCTNKICANDQKRVRFDDEKFNFEKIYDLKVSNIGKPFIDKAPTIVLKKMKINTTESRKIITDEEIEYCKKVKVVVKRLRGDIIKKQLSMLSYPRKKNYSNMNVQRSSNSLQRNLKLSNCSPSKNSLMFSVLQYSIDHTNILQNLKNKSCKKNINSSTFLNKKKLGRSVKGLNVAFKVFCTLQLNYSIHKINTLLTSF